MWLQLSTINSHTSGEEEGDSPRCSKGVSGGKCCTSTTLCINTGAIGVITQNHVTTFHTNNVDKDGWQNYHHNHNVPSLGRMLHVCSSGMACTIKFNVFHFGLLVSFHIANLRLQISGNEVTPGENREHLHPVKFPMYTWSQETPHVTSYYIQATKIHVQ